jgi:hypothetical protein
MRRAWIGKSLISIGVIHSIFGIVVFHKIIGDIVAEMLMNTIHDQYDRNSMFWFLFGGFILIIIGGLIDWMERKNIEIPSFLKWSFLILMILGCLIMPQSGFWLMLIPIFGLFMRGSIRHLKK